MNSVCDLNCKSSAATGKKPRALQLRAVAILALGSATGVAFANVNYGGLQLCDQTQAAWGTSIGNNRQISAVACGGAYYSFWLGNGVTATGGGTTATTAALWGNAAGQLHLVGRGGVFLDGASTFGGTANLNNNKIVGLANGTAATDAVNVRQLNAAVAGAAGSNYVKVNAGTGANGGVAAATNAGSVAIGGGAAADAGGATSAAGGGVAVGQGAKALRSSVAMGANASAQSAAGQHTALALGTAAVANGAGATALGSNANATAASALAVGSQASALGVNSSALGTGASVTAAGTNSVALGRGSVATIANVVSVGTTAAGGQRRIVNLAAGTAATDAVNVAQLNTKVDNAYVRIGSYSGNAGAPPAAAAVASNYGLAMGVSAATNNWHGTALGTSTTASYASTAVGRSAVAGAQAATRNASAFGAYASALAAQSTALGSAATVEAGAANAVALGMGSVADTADTVSLGNGGISGGMGAATRRVVNMTAGRLAANSADGVNGSQLFATNERVRVLETSGAGDALVSFNESLGRVEVAPAKEGNAVHIGGTAGSRRLTGLANGLHDDEAVTIAQLKAAGVLDPASGTILSALVYDDTSLATSRLGGTHGTVIDNLGNGEVNAGSRQAVNGGQLFQALGNAASLLGGGASVGLQGAFVAPTYAIQGSAYRNVGDALGALDRKVSELDQRSASSGAGAFGIMGSDAVSRVEDAGASVSVPSRAAEAPAPVATAAGELAAATSGTGTALGEAALASGVGSAAIGDHALAHADGSVALGSGSVADRVNSVSVGSAGNERQLTNVAEGTADTDAVNKAQLDRGVASANRYTDSTMSSLNDSFEGLKRDVDGRLRTMDRRIDRQGAMSAAMLNMATSAAGVHTDNRVGVGVGFQGGESALSLGYQRAISERATLTLGGAVSGDDASVGFGAGFGW